MSIPTFELTYSEYESVCHTLFKTHYEGEISEGDYPLTERQLFMCYRISMPPYMANDIAADVALNVEFQEAYEFLKNVLENEK